ncbi:NUDIX hydrolase [Bacillus sp. AK031]
MKKENTMVVAVKGLILNEGKALIVKRADDDEVGGGTWECAGGKIDFGENLEPALVREAKEETGLDILIEKILYATTFKTDPNRQVIVLTYLCKSNSRDVVLSKEHSEYLWADKDQITGLLSPAIIDDLVKNRVFRFIEDYPGS